MLAEVKMELDSDWVNIRTSTSPSVSNSADIMAADEPRWEKSRVTVAMADSRQSATDPFDSCNTNAIINYESKTQHYS